ncbi:MAG: hypothetical protein ABIP64_01075, partial [Burkholderiales bacterium]
SPSILLSRWKRPANQPACPRNRLKFNPNKPIWLEAESKKIRERQIPIKLFYAMHAGVPFRVEAPMAERVTDELSSARSP